MVLTVGGVDDATCYFHNLCDLVLMIFPGDKKYSYIWVDGVQLWGSASNSSIEILERFQSNVLRIITDATWYYFDIFVNCNWVNTRWQWYSTHNQYIGQHK